MESNIKTFEDACKAQNVNPELLPDVSVIPEKYQKRAIADYKLSVIADALNEGWEPDWSNSGERKYFPWFEVDADKANPSGFGFSDARYDYWDTGTIVGSRLCFKSSELALYAGKQFEQLYIDHQLNRK